ncbi:MAG: M23 family metallopeptidase [Alistipes sp.]|nr:M23 family metallopeptidase [Alistipes sp.]
MKLKQKLRKFFRKKRFSMSDPILNREEWSVHTSPAALLGGLAAFCIFLFLLILIFVAYTPILNIFPGYRTDAERLHDRLVQSIMRIDSLDSRINDMLTYNENIAMIMQGKTPVLPSRQSDGQADTTSLDKTLIPPSQLDSLLRLQMEGESNYSLSRTLQNLDKTSQTAFEFAVPVEGIITRHFSRNDNYLGVGIQAAPNSPVSSIDDGTVVSVITATDAGMTITIQHFNGFLSIYKNVTQPLVSQGQAIKSGQVIGYNAMHKAGDKTNPLLELEIWDEGKAVDPEMYIVF